MILQLENPLGRESVHRKSSNFTEQHKYGQNIGQASIPFIEFQPMTPVF
jgi:hypothetical protein